MSNLLVNTVHKKVKAEWNVKYKQTHTYIMLLIVLNAIMQYMQLFDDVYVRHIYFTIIGLNHTE
jgi:hypothetical protein